MNTRTLLGCVALLVVLAAPRPAAADLAVDWGGDYVATSQQFSNQFTGFTGGFSGGNPLIISPGANYAGTSATFYGSITNYGGPALANYGVVANNTTLDRLELKGSNSGDTNAYLVVWRQADFLNGLNTGNVGFDTNATVRLNIASYTGISEGRLVLRQGASYYISSSIYTSTGFKTNAPTSLSWFNYNPSLVLSNIGSAATLVTGNLITNITEVGFYFYAANTGSDAARVQDFEVNLLVIPEPSTLFLVGVSVVGAVLLRRRNRSRNGTDSW